MNFGKIINVVHGEKIYNYILEKWEIYFSYNKNLYEIVYFSMGDIEG